MTEELAPALTFEKICSAIETKGQAPHTSLVWVNRLGPHGLKESDPLTQQLVPTLTIRIRMPYSGGMSGISPNDAPIARAQIKEVLSELEKQLRALNEKPTELAVLVRTLGIENVFVELVDKGKQGHTYSTKVVCESPWIIKRINQKKPKKADPKITPNKSKPKNKSKK